MQLLKKQVYNLGPKWGNLLKKSAWNNAFQARKVLSSCSNSLPAINWCERGGCGLLVTMSLALRKTAGMHQARLTMRYSKLRWVSFNLTILLETAIIVKSLTGKALALYPW
jgi:hypothetical protein